MSEASAPKRVNRRTVAKGAAWTVPAIVVAAPAASAASSPPEEPPPPTFEWLNAYKNPGGSCESPCVPKQSYGVPVVLSNPTVEDFQIQFTSYLVEVNAQGGGGTSLGVFGVTAGVGSTPAACVALSTGCTPACGGPPDDYATHAVCVPAGTTNLTVYVTSNTKGNSSQASQRVDYRWVRKSTCEITDEDFRFSPTSPPNDIPGC